MRGDIPDHTRNTFVKIWLKHLPTLSVLGVRANGET